jgi:hypothetical protein
MNGVAAGAAGDVDQLVDAEVTLARRCRPDGIGFIGQADVEGSAIGFAEDRDGADSKFAAGPQDADGDFSAISDQDFVEHGVARHINTRRKSELTADG